MWFMLCITWNKGVMGEELFERVAGVCRRVKHLLASYEEENQRNWTVLFSMWIGYIDYYLL